MEILMEFAFFNTFIHDLTHISRKDSPKVKDSSFVYPRATEKAAHRAISTFKLKIAQYQAYIKPL